jgi:hypothetical protein
MSRLPVLVVAGVGLLAGVGWFAAAADRQPAILRSEHSRPARMPPPAMVAVTTEGKLYHKPDCTYIHGPSQLESGAQAQADGYTPCTRCLKE